MRYITMLPFLSKEDLKELAYKIINMEEKKVRLVLLFPFLDSETLDEIVDKLIEEKKGKDLGMAAPFVSKETIAKIYKANEKEDIKGFRKEMLLPFLDRSTVKEMFEDSLKNAPIIEDDEDEEDDE